MCFIGRQGGYVYILFYMLIKSKEYSSSTLLTRHKIHSDTLKSFDTHLRTKPNYYLPKLTLKISPKPITK